MASTQLTPRELKILVAFVAECKTDVDWAKVAAKANCTTPKYARDKFALIRNKLTATLDTAGGDANGGAATPKTKPALKKASTGKRKNAEANVDDEEESPTKKPKKAAAPRKTKSATPAAAKAGTPAKAKSATPAETKEKIPAEENGEGAEEAVIKAEPNEAGEMMDAMEGTS